MKLKYVLALAMVFLTATPLFFSLQYLNSFANEQYRLQFGEKLSALSLSAKKRVLAVVDRVNDNTALIASRTQMRKSLEQWNATQEPAHLEKIQRIIMDAKQDVSRLHEIAIYDHDGKLVASTRPDQVVDTLSESRRNSSQIQLVSLNNTLYVKKASRLILDDKSIGFIRTLYYANFLTELIADREGLGGTGEWQIATRDESGDALFVVPLQQDSNAAFNRRVPKSAIDQPVTQAMLSNELIMYSAPNYLGNAVMASTRYIPELDWGLVVQVDENEVNQIINDSSRAIYYMEVVIIVLSALVGLALALRISRPMEQLIEHTQMVAKGNFIEHTPTGGWREIKELNKHFNFMVNSLKDLNENLNKKVLERTHQLDEANKQLKDMASRDPLTGLYNRRYLNERLEQEISRCKRYKESLALVMIDIDHFKSVNDTWGHSVGDEVLKKVSHYLKDSLRDSDILARIGGEEFCLILPSFNSAMAMTFLDRLRNDIAKLGFSADNRAFHVTCSFGVAYLSDDIKHQDQLMKKADVVLYQAKNAGRNRVLQEVVNS